MLAAAVAGVALTVAFVMIERRSADPLMPLRLFRDRDLSAGVVTTFLFMAAFGTVVYFLMAYFQNVHGYSPLLTGIAYLVPMAAVIVGSNSGSRLATRFGMRATLRAGIGLGAVGAVWLGLAMSPTASYVALVPAMLIFSLGQGLVYTTMFAAAAAGVPAHDQGIASGMASSGQQIGGAVGLAVLVAVSNAGTDGYAGEALRAAVTDGLRTAVFVAAAGIVAMLVAVRHFERTPKTSSERQADPVPADASLE
ncbi:MFS transporter [Sphaerisporangium fuscum]|uniref:MFS transporter n=1 Tax=Sphaerisporangium fuscum TaxID=2835868 RepID=UPI001BDD64DA|nr:MFS transporter [Sphaerisporangium fuscum]